ncbi:MAG: hypothetical protein O6848_03310, partial [Bacteroidetes bacterium]|nr:hypothetical protein [Bacteroidota bacterium]
NWLMRDRIFRTCSFLGNKCLLLPDIVFSRFSYNHSLSIKNYLDIVEISSCNFFYTADQNLLSKETDQGEKY